MICMKVIKKNQILVFVFALMLITAGYMNYSRNSKASLQTAGLLDSEEVAGIGDAKLVSNNNVVDENSINNESSINSDNINAKDSISENVVNDNIAVQTSTQASEYFESSRLSREKMYSQILETYQKILESNSVSEEQKAISQAEITKVQNTKNGIMISENLIKNKGIKDVIIFVNDYSISVIVDAETLGEAEIAQIQNIIVRELKAKVEDIHVSKK